MASSRPDPFPDGMHVGLHLTVERLLSTGTNRTFYLANNFEPRWEVRMCWNCGNKRNAPTAESCVYCQTPLRPRRFLMCARWNTAVQGFHAYSKMRLAHASLNLPIVLYQYEKQLLAFYELGDDGLLVDEPAPLHPRTLLSTAWTLAGGLHHLHRNGIVLAGVHAENILVHKERARWFDLDIAEIRPRPIPPGDATARENVCALGALLLSLTPLDQPEMREFFADAADDVYLGAKGMQRDLQAFARETRLTSRAASSAAGSVVGRVRSHNEDSWAWNALPQARVAIVADGMGGYQSGDEASKRAVNAALTFLTEKLPTKPLAGAAAEKLFTEAFTLANQAVIELGAGIEGPTGTTLLVAVLWPGGKVQVGHVGDSRCYKHSAGSLTPLTEDHSMVAAMVANGKIDREAARTHPKSNVLLQFIGNDQEVEIDFHDVTLRTGDQLLLCSDGLWGELPERIIEERLNANLGARRQARALMTAASEAGGTDNITVMVLDI